MFGRALLQTVSPKKSEEPLLFGFTSAVQKKRLLLSGAFLVKLFSKKVFGRAEAPQEVMSNKPLLSPKEAETVSIRWA
jgi:hypothetical protein